MKKNIQLICPETHKPLYLSDDQCYYQTSDGLIKYPIEEGVVRFLQKTDDFYEGAVTSEFEDEAIYSCEVATAGNMHSNRAALFNQLTEFDCKIWGNPSAHWLDVSPVRQMIQNQFVANEEKSKSFLEPEIVINSLQLGEFGGTNVRTFEIAAAASFQLVNDRPALHDSFKVGKETKT
jgi:hypothetical protein